MDHAFCTSNAVMPYSDCNLRYREGRYEYDKDMPSHPGRGEWNYWGYYRMVRIQEKKVLLFTSNTHLDWSKSNT